MARDHNPYTPEEQDRAAAETDPRDHYDDGRPKMHRHFCEFDVHRDDQCDRASRRIRVYVFDSDELDRHERHITQRAQAEVYDQVAVLAEAAGRRVRR